MLTPDAGRTLVSGAHPAMVDPLVRRAFAPSKGRREAQPAGCRHPRLHRPLEDTPKVAARLASDVDIPRGDDVERIAVTRSTRVVWSDRSDERSHRGQ
jgi:hypothetical protein